MVNKEFNIETSIVVLTRKEIEKKEFDWDKDLEDEICSRLSIETFREMRGGWDVSGNYYVCVVEVK